MYYITLKDNKTGKINYLNTQTNEWCDDASKATSYPSDTEAMKVAQFLPRYSNIVRIGA